MKRTAGTVVLLAALGGCVSTGSGPYVGDRPGSQGCGIGCQAGAPPTVPGVQGPYGQPIAMVAPYSAAPPSGNEAARAMLSRSVPMDVIQQTGFAPPPGALAGGPPGGVMPPPGAIAPPGVPTMPGMPGGPTPTVPPPGGYPPGAVAAVGALTGGVPPGARVAAQRTSVRFVGPAGMKISWYAPSPDSKNGFSGTAIEAPGRYNFPQAAIYRLKLSDIPGRPGLELYPTLEVVPSNNKTSTFLAHSAVPVSFTEEDFEQVAAGNFVVKVIYLPDPQFQDLATVGPDEVVSSRLEPGVDPIAEALKRGCILLVVRLGNIDLEAPNTPAMDAPSPFQQHSRAPMPPQMPGGGMMAPGMAGPGPMMPYGMMNPNRGMTPPGAMVPPAQVPGAPGAVPTQPGLPGGVSRLPDPRTVQPAGAMTPAEMAGGARR